MSFHSIEIDDTTSYPTDDPTVPYSSWSPTVDQSIEPTLEPTFEPTYNSNAPTLEPTVYPTVDESSSHEFTKQTLDGFIFAFLAGLVFAWSKLLLPLINVLVRGSSNKLERGKTFGVLSSIESVCTYGGPLAVVNLWTSNLPVSAFIVCMVLAVIGFIWLFIKIKQIIMMNGRIPAFEEWNQNGRSNGGGASYHPDDHDNRNQNLFDL